MNKMQEPISAPAGEPGSTARSGLPWELPRFKNWLAVARMHQLWKKVFSEALAPLLEWIGNHLGEELDVDTLARQMHMSPRTFARRFKEETGTTPYSWILNERVRAAQELLERIRRHQRAWRAVELVVGGDGDGVERAGSGVQPSNDDRLERDVSAQDVPEPGQGLLKVRFAAELAPRRDVDAI